MLNSKDYCDYELRLRLRDIGYPMSTCQINDGPIQMPKITLYEAQKFLREEKGIEVNASWDNEKSFWFWYISRMDDVDFSTNIVSESIYNHFEEALSEGIKEAVKILKEE